MNLLPNDIEAEQGVLGSIMNYNIALSQVRGMLSVDCFYTLGHQYIYKAMCSLEDSQDPIDEITLKARLGENIERVAHDGMAGWLYLLDLPDKAPHYPNVLVYAEVVLEKWKAREAVVALEEAAESIRKAGALKGQSDDVVKVLEHLEVAGQIHQTKTMADAVPEFMEWLENPDAVTFKAKTHTRIDNLIGGLSDERPTVIAARTGVGKTSFLVQVARDNALAGLPTLLLNLEMNDRTVIMRCISSMTGVDGNKLSKKKIDELDSEDWDAMAVKIPELIDAPLYVHSPTHAITVGQLFAIVRWHITNKDVGLVVIDHLARIYALGKIYEAQTERIMGIVRMMRRLQIPVLVGAQIGRAGENSPTLVDLKGSGDIEENAQVVIILHDPEPDDNDAHEIEVRVAKNANGGKGLIDPPMQHIPWKFIIR